MALLAQDPFDRSNAATLGQDWTTFSGDAQSLAILNNAVSANAIESEGNLYTGRNIIWPADQWAQATFPNLVGAAGTQGIVLRGQDSSNYYGAGIDPNNRGSNNTLIWKLVAGVWTQLADSGAVDISGGSWGLFRARGINLEFYVNGVLKCSASDSSLAVANSPGLHASATATGTTYFGAFYAGDFLESKNQPPNAAGVGGYSVQ